MPISVTETAAQFAQRLLETAREQEENPAAELRKMTLRVPEEIVTILDYVGGKLRLSRTALAEELLCRAAEEVLAIVGQPSQEEGGELIIPSEVEAAVKSIMLKQAIEQLRKNPDALTDRQMKTINSIPSANKLRKGGGKEAT